MPITLGQPITKIMKLDNVTICAVDSKQPELAKEAIDRSCKLVEFADKVLISPPIRNIQDYSYFMLTELHKYIHTDFVLVVQWDGWVINENAWNPLFLDYDYIGAVWPWHPEGKKVGNGGFSLRSKKLLELTAHDHFIIKEINEDDLICHTNRDFLESHGIKFAPEELAREFSYERELSNIPSFGFHGEFNMHRHL